MGIAFALLLLFAGPDGVQELEQTLKQNAKQPYEQWPREKAIGALGRAVVEDDEMGDMLDPSSLLMIVDALVGLTEGVAVDPASGAILS